MSNDDDLKPYTAEETRAHFLDHVRMVARYWAGVDLQRTRLPTQPPLTPIQERLERAEGAVFSMLTLLDGCTEFPAVCLSIETHPTDEAHHRSRGERWYEDGLTFNGGVHMHDELGHGLTFDKVITALEDATAARIADWVDRVARPQGLSPRTIGEVIRAGAWRTP